MDEDERKRAERRQEAAQPVERRPQKFLDQLILDLLRDVSNPTNILFVSEPGRGALMLKDFTCRPIPHAWIRRLVRRAYIDQEISSKSKVAAMGWVQYVITYEGQQALNRMR